MPINEDTLTMMGKLSLCQTCHSLCHLEQGQFECKTCGVILCTLHAAEHMTLTQHIVEGL